MCRLLKTSGILEADQADTIRNVWCFAHRLNLATRDMRDVPGMDEVFSVAD